MEDEPIMDMAHLGHRELLTPKPKASLRFFVDVIGHAAIRAGSQQALARRVAALAPGGRTRRGHIGRRAAGNEFPFGRAALPEDAQK